MSSVWTVHFDQHNPSLEKSKDARHDSNNLDYSPLRRVTGRSFLLAVFVSMGGLMYVMQIQNFLRMAGMPN